MARNGEMVGDVEMVDLADLQELARRVFVYFNADAEDQEDDSIESNQGEGGGPVSGKPCAHLNIFIENILKNRDHPEHCVRLESKLVSFLDFSIMIARKNLDHIKSNDSQSSQDALTMLVLSSFASMHVFNTKELVYLRQIKLHINPHQLLKWCGDHGIEFTEQENCPDEEYYFRYLEDKEALNLLDSTHVLAHISSRLYYSAHDGRTPSELKNILSTLKDADRCNTILKNMEIFRRKILRALAKPFLDKVKELVNKHNGASDSIAVNINDLRLLLDSFMGHMKQTEKSTGSVIGKKGEKPTSLKELARLIEPEISRREEEKANISASLRGGGRGKSVFNSRSVVSVRSLFASPGTAPS